MKEAPIGFATKTIFLQPVTPFLRGDVLSGLVMCIPLMIIIFITYSTMNSAGYLIRSAINSEIIMGGFGASFFWLISIIFFSSGIAEASLYNKFYIRNLLKQGYLPSEGEEALQKALQAPLFNIK